MNGLFPWSIRSAVGGRRLIWLLIPLCSTFGDGCALPFEAIDASLAREARLALRQERPPQFNGEDVEEPEEEPARKSVIVAELLAIFPGFLWHGLGHQYAGDTLTARRINKAGQWGYLLTALGGGIAFGGYLLDQAEAGDHLQGLVISLYSTGGVTGSIGVGFFLTAWFYDMIDTPRAVRTGGQPPPPGTMFGHDMGELGD